MPRHAIFLLCVALGVSLVRTSPFVPAVQVDIDSLEAQSKAILERKKEIDLAAEKSEQAAERAMREAQEEEEAERKIEQAPQWLKKAVDDRFESQDAQFKAAAMAKLKKAVKETRNAKAQAEAAAYGAMARTSAQGAIPKIIPPPSTNRGMLGAETHWQVMETPAVESAAAPLANVGSPAQVASSAPMDFDSVLAGVLPNTETVSVALAPDLASTGGFQSQHMTGLKTLIPAEPLTNTLLPAEPLTTDARMDAMIEQALKQKYSNNVDPEFLNAARIRIKKAIQAKLRANTMEGHQEDQTPFKENIEEHQQDSVKQAFERNLKAPGAPHLSHAATERLRKRFEAKLKDKIAAKQNTQVQESDTSAQSDDSVAVDSQQHQQEEEDNDGEDKENTGDTQQQQQEGQDDDGGNQDNADDSSNEDAPEQTQESHNAEEQEGDSETALFLQKRAVHT